ncbi:MAG: CPXCG motif-containing cysteine-rich protein [Halioglobus sp.]
MDDVFDSAGGSAGDLLHERNVYCPYCGESISVLLDTSEIDQQYIEDCQVCCRPIDFVVSQDVAGDLIVTVSHENE